MRTGKTTFVAKAICRCPYLHINLFPLNSVEMLCNWSPTKGSDLQTSLCSVFRILKYQENHLAMKLQISVKQDLCDPHGHTVRSLGI